MEKEEENNNKNILEENSEKEENAINENHQNNILEECPNENNDEQKEINKNDDIKENNEVKDEENKVEENKEEILEEIKNKEENNIENQNDNKEENLKNEKGDNKENNEQNIINNNLKKDILNENKENILEENKEKDNVLEENKGNILEEIKENKDNVLEEIKENKDNVLEEIKENNDNILEEVKENNDNILEEVKENKDNILEEIKENNNNEEIKEVKLDNEENKIIEEGNIKVNKNEENEEENDEGSEEENENKNKIVEEKENITIKRNLPDSDDYDNSIKVILLGDSYVGKSSLLNRLINNEFSEQQATIAIESRTYTISLNEYSIRMQIWDTAGQEKFNSIISNYYKGTDVGIFIYSINKEESFENVKDWFNVLKEKGNENSISILLGNKKDLGEKERIVTYKQGKDFAKENKFKFFREISCKSEEKEEIENIMEIFDEIGKYFYDIFKSRRSASSSADLNYVATASMIALGEKLRKKENNKGKKCCSK